MATPTAPVLKTKSVQSQMLWPHAGIHGPKQYKLVRMRRSGVLRTCILVTLVLASGLSDLTAGTHPKGKHSEESRDWPVYGGSPEYLHYSPLSQINRSNVKRLQVAWTYDTGEQGGLQTSPLVVDGVLYGITPTQKIFAVDAATGKELWKFDSGIKGMQPDRGLAYWSDKSDKRIFVGVMNFLYALDAKTGKPIPTFGTDGRVDLQENLGREPRFQSVALTSPGVIYKDLIIVGGRNPETLPAPPATYALTRFAPANFAGRSTPFRIRANSATIHGPKRHGKQVAPPITGPACLSTASAELSIFRRARPPSTSMAVIAWVTTYSQTVCWL